MRVREEESEFDKLWIVTLCICINDVIRIPYVYINDVTQTSISSGVRGQFNAALLFNHILPRVPLPEEKLPKVQMGTSLRQAFLDWFCTRFLREWHRSLHQYFNFFLHIPFQDLLKLSNLGLNFTIYIYFRYSELFFFLYGICILNFCWLYSLIQIFIIPKEELIWIVIELVAIPLL